jgi:hypothetical protein
MNGTELENLGKRIDAVRQQSGIGELEKTATPPQTTLEERYRRTQRLRWVIVLGWVLIGAAQVGVALHAGILPTLPGFALVGFGVADFIRSARGGSKPSRRMASG